MSSRCRTPGMHVEVRLAVIFRHVLKRITAWPRQQELYIIAMILF